MGTSVNPLGESIEINSQGMIWNNEQVLPVMGEFHFSRYPDTEWKKELLKMKAGGINIIASYVFWIHHEEVEGSYNWKGQRNLRKFVETCRELDLPIVLRIGPWCHGEARNGGLPEWLVTSGIKLRDNNPDYIEKVQTWFGELYKQVEGVIWKEGGPVIGVQIENEFGGQGEHLMKLKEIAQKQGFDVPLYTKTGWPQMASPIPFGEMIPLFGDYPDGFWDRTLQEMPGDYGRGYFFRSFRNSTVIATEQLPGQSDKDNPTDLEYPFFTCELGGGMTPSYHRRINISPMDVYSLALVKVGSGSNLPGYYMYHGGTNPDGEVTTLNEMQSTLYTNYNDLPVKSYDFQAPLGEFGQVNPHYHLLRRLHLFLHDFGHELTSMEAHFPDPISEDFNDDSLLRWSVRSNGESGYVFVNNYHRLKTLSSKDNVQFTINLPTEELIFPQKPFTVPSGASFFMPFNLNLDDVRLVYSTAQPVAKLIEKDESVFVFTENVGINTEFVFEAKGIKIESSNIKVHQQNGRIYIDNVKTGTNAIVKIRNSNNKLISIVLLNEETSLSLWKGKLQNKEHLFLTNSELTYHNNQLELTDKVGSEIKVGIYPQPQTISYNGHSLKGKSNGMFTDYYITCPAFSEFKVELMPVKAAAPVLRKIAIGGAGVAEQPSDADFDRAAVWKIVLPEQMNPSRDIYLKFPYMGDVARIYLDDRLLTDNFYNGKSFLLGLKRFAPEIYKKELIIKILPFAEDSPVYLPGKEQLNYQGSDFMLDLPKVEIEEKTIISLLLN